MFIALKKKLHTTAELSSFIGALGDISIDVTKKVVVVHDNSTAGGFPLALESHTHSNATTSDDGFMSAADKTALDNHLNSTDGHPIATASDSGFISAADKQKIDGLTSGGGGVPQWASTNTANNLVIRDGSGNFAAEDITAEGEFIGDLTGNADTVTNGVVTTSSYADPSWITSLAGAKITGNISGTSGGADWANITNRPTALSAFSNDVPYVTPAGNVATATAVVGQTSSPTANTVLVRDANGRAQVATPVASSDIATKNYVDANASGATRLAAFNSAGTQSWVVPDGVGAIKAVLIGGGGGGEGSEDNANRGGGGGGGGALAISDFIPVTAGETLTVVVGAAGSGGAANGGNGSAGGDSRIQRSGTTLAEADSGKGGGTTAGLGSGGTGGVATTSVGNWVSVAGNNGATTTNTSGGTGGNAAGRSLAGGNPYGAGSGGIQDNAGTNYGGGGGGGRYPGGGNSGERPGQPGGSGRVLIYY